MKHARNTLFLGIILITATITNLLAQASESYPTAPCRKRSCAHDRWCNRRTRSEYRYARRNGGWRGMRRSVGSGQPQSQMKSDVRMWLSTSSGIRPEGTYNSEASNMPTRRGVN